MRYSQTVLDALADAQTLRLVSIDCWSGAAGAVTFFGECAKLNLPSPAGVNLSIQAAHAAFSACPGLRCGA